MLVLKIMNVGTEEMAQQLGVLTVLAEGLSSVHSTHIEWSQMPIILASGEFDAFCPCWTIAPHVHTYIHTHN